MNSPNDEKINSSPLEIVKEDIQESSPVVGQLNRMMTDDVVLNDADWDIIYSIIIVIIYDKKKKICQ